MMGMRPGIWLTTLAAPWLVVGCAPTHSDMLQFLRAHEHDVSAIAYRIGVPDSIAISAPSVPEIDGEGQTLQPNGKISLRLLGEVKIVGMTAKEIAAKLEVLLSRYYLEPKVSVRVVGYESKKYYVYGPVGGQAFAYTGRDTLMDAVVRFGADFRSWTSRVKVTRPTHDATEPHVIQVNVDRMVRAGDWSKNILLEPDDIVYIPPTPLAWLGLRIRELLDPVGPVLDAYVTPAEVITTADVYDDLNTNRSRTSGRVGRRGRF